MRPDPNKQRRRNERRESDIRRSKAMVARSHQGGVSTPQALPVQIANWLFHEALISIENDLTRFLLARKSPQGRIAAVKFAIKPGVGIRAIEAHTFHSEDGYEMLWRDGFFDDTVIVSDIETVTQAVQEAFAVASDSTNDFKSVLEMIGLQTENN